MKLGHHLKECSLCPRECKVDRRTTSGVCGVGYFPKISNIVLHKGEEPPISGENGAGAVFFSGCPMKCIYCQNMGFSQKGIGKEIKLDDLIHAFRVLEKEKAHTLDLVTPTPHLPWIVEALDSLKNEGFSLPVVYNTSSYEKVDILRELEGLVDIYLADIRYTDSSYGLRYSKVPDYWEVARKAIFEMYRQVGPYRDNKRKGLIIRILVLPNNVSGHEKALEFIAHQLDPSVPVALMSQYLPHFEAKKDPLIGRKITTEEYEKAIEMMLQLGLDGWYQTDEVERVTARGVDWLL
ncbi:MAG: putative pyruvate formate lyase activating enzyme [Thermotogota bacterium]|nr:putative pyruvate formate lyase activating enzyme [Thermotogota bacterium]MDK2865482.1 putative pyruvate formate lyase activating enzyme [Thermotogota bacterium]